MLSLKRLVMLRMQFVVAMAMILMGIGYGWNLRMVGGAVHHLIVIAVTTVAEDVEYPGDLNIVC